MNQKKATKDAFEDWSGARGLAEDVRRYGAWMRDEAQQAHWSSLSQDRYYRRDGGRTPGSATLLG